MRPSEDARLGSRKIGGRMSLRVIRRYSSAPTVGSSWRLTNRRHRHHTDGITPFSIGKKSPSTVGGHGIVSIWSNIR